MTTIKKLNASAAVRRRASAAEFLGEVFAEIAGVQYYNAIVDPGDKIELEREPENKHDKNAIRIENKNFRQAGYVPRKISSWLAPLIDSGEVWVEGRVADSSKAPDSNRTFILIELYLSRKGRRLLERGADPKDISNGLHQAMLAIWSEIDAWTDGDIVSALGARLNALAAEDLLPQTRMLLSLFKHRAWALRRRSTEKALEDVRGSIEGIKAGKALFHHNLTIFPLILDIVRKPDYLLLKEAIAKKQAEVREVSEAGSVPELVVENRASVPILIPEGEILIGARQNRTVNVSILVREKTAHVIPVSCVEQGRWSATSPTFDAGHFATPGLRGRKIASSQANRRTTGQAFSDQAQVWDDVARSLGAAGAHSMTGSITDAFETAKERTKIFRRKLTLPAKAAGVLVASGQEIVGMDLFDSPKTMRKIWPRLSEGYFLEAAFRGKRRKTARTTAALFMKKLPSIVAFAEKTSGAGRELEFSGKAYAGSGLWHNGRICHLSAFRSKKPKSGGRPRPPAI